MATSQQLQESRRSDAAQEVDPMFDAHRHSQIVQAGDVEHVASDTKTGHTNSDDLDRDGQSRKDAAERKDKKDNKGKKDKKDRKDKKVKKEAMAEKGRRDELMDGQSSLVKQLEKDQTLDSLALLLAEHGLRSVAPLAIDDFLAMVRQSRNVSAKEALYMVMAAVFPRQKKIVMAVNEHTVPLGKLIKDEKMKTSDVLWAFNKYLKQTPDIAKAFPTVLEFALEKRWCKKGALVRYYREGTSLAEPGFQEARRAASDFLKAVDEPDEEDLEDKHDARLSGTVKMFDVAKGFGFITTSQTYQGTGFKVAKGCDIFVHFRDITAPAKDGQSPSLSKGEVVEFEVVESKRKEGQPKAIHVTGRHGEPVFGCYAAGHTMRGSALQSLAHEDILYVGASSSGGEDY